MLAQHHFDSSPSEFSCHHVFYDVVIGALTCNIYFPLKCMQDWNYSCLVNVSKKAFLTYDAFLLFCPVGGFIIKLILNKCLATFTQKFQRCFHT